MGRAIPWMHIDMALLRIPHRLRYLFPQCSDISPQIVRQIDTPNLSVSTAIGNIKPPPSELVVRDMYDFFIEPPKLYRIFICRYV